MIDYLEYPVEALQAGVALDAATGGYTCLECGAVFEAGEVYPVDGHFLAPQRAAHRHVQDAHGDRLEALIAGGGRYMTLTGHQVRLLQLMAAGRSDAEIAAETGTAPATVRRQRFTFREKARQATLYLAMYGLAVQGHARPGEELLPVRTAARGVDDRFVLTRAESEQYLAAAFESLEPLRLRALPAKEKKKVAVLNRIAAQFEKGRDYTEREVNGVLKAIQPDEYVTLRRYLIEYGFLARVADGSRYWVP